MDTSDASASTMTDAVGTSSSSSDAALPVPVPVAAKKPRAKASTPASKSKGKSTGPLKRTATEMGPMPTLGKGGKRARPAASGGMVVHHVSGLPKERGCPFISSGLVVASDTDHAARILAATYYESEDSLGDKTVDSQVHKWLAGGITVDMTKPHFYNVSYGNATVRRSQKPSTDARRAANAESQQLWVCRDFPDNGGAAAVAFVVADTLDSVNQMTSAYVATSVEDGDQRDPEFVKSCGHLGSVQEISITTPGFVLLSDGAPSSAL